MKADTDMDLEQLRNHPATPVQSLFNASGTAILERVRAAKLDTVDVIFLRDIQTLDITICLGRKIIDERSITNEPFEWGLVELDYDTPEREVYRFLRLIEGIRGHQDSALWESHWAKLPWPGPDYAIDRSAAVA